MSIVSIVIEDETTPNVFDYNQWIDEVETVWGTVSRLTDLLEQKKSALAKQQEIINSPELSKKETFKKMLTVAFLALEVYIFYVLPVGFISRGLQSFVSEHFANRIDGKLTSLVFGLGIGRSIHLLFSRLFLPSFKSYPYEALRSEALTLLTALQGKVDLLAKRLTKEEQLSMLDPVRVKIAKSRLDLLTRFPHRSLLIGN